ncbi:hypothetical protein [Vibrio sp. VB16]|uniref:hypothetical protein n=1 Tax=Vibrio sp. VB16 TaxID=2785746 RepID=UPI001E4A657C|nr:hypothetical protein [Vibrio sp. VB16]UGA54181.1 hypothetical protein IUZ65_013040 [Vibrio sp. VB16]
MKTIICNSVQSFLDMAENNFLNGLNVHCVFPANDSVKTMIMHCQRRHSIQHVSFSETVSERV